MSVSVLASERSLQLTLRHIISIIPAAWSRLCETFGTLVFIDLSYRFQDFEKYENISEEWEEPKKAEYVDQGNLRSWLLEPDSCDQYR